MRQELPAESCKRLERVISSGVRMQRMIEQIQDLTRARLSAGLKVVRVAEHDLGLLVAGRVEAVRIAHPNRAIELQQATNSVVAQVDAESINRVVFHLIENAVTHGDPYRPIRVVVEKQEDSACIAVHNFGPPIDPDSLPFPFQPFKGGRKPKGTPAGLGLGLYISERIGSAHGGTRVAASSLERGTCFRITLPLN